MAANKRMTQSKQHFLHADTQPSPHYDCSSRGNGAVATVAEHITIILNKLQGRAAQRQFTIGSKQEALMFAAVLELNKTLDLETNKQLAQLSPRREHPACLNHCKHSRAKANGRKSGSRTAFAKAKAIRQINRSRHLRCATFVRVATKQRLFWWPRRPQMFKCVRCL